MDSKDPQTDSELGTESLQADQCLAFLLCIDSLSLQPHKGETEREREEKKGGR